MATEIKIPRLGWTMEEGKFVAWLKRDGDAVSAGEPLFTLEGEKATQDVESIAGGVLRIPRDGPEAGEVLGVGAIIGWITAPGERMPERPREVQPASPAPSISAPPLSPSPSARRDDVSGVRLGRTRVAISPRALRLAAEHGVEWTQLRGSGSTGRIRAKDILQAAQGKAGPLSSVRRAIAERLSFAAERVVPVTLMKEVEAAELVRWRETRLATDGPAPSITDIFVRLVAGALEEHGALNAVWAGDRLATSEAVHIAIAVDTDRGLLAPVLRDTQKLALGEIAKQTRDLIDRARAGRLRADELEGGTFTITNLGSLGIDAFTPVVNFPQVAILGLGRIRRTLWLSLTFDHRALDGAPAARFLSTLEQHLADPSSHLEASTK